MAQISCEGGWKVVKCEHDKQQIALKGNHCESKRSDKVLTSLCETM